MTITDEQFREIVSQLQGLPPEEQQKKFQEITSKLSPEDQKELVEKLTGGAQQSGGQCPFCLMVEGKIETATVYEDDVCKAVLDINPATKGHVILFPKTHYQFMPQMPDNEVGHVFKVANRISEILFEMLGAQGTNILVANGPGAGQKAPHVIINIIPRFEGDGVQFGWNPLKMDGEEVNKIAQALAQKTSQIKIGKEQAVVAEDVTEVDDFEDYRVP